MQTFLFFFLNKRLGYMQALKFGTWLARVLLLFHTCCFFFFWSKWKISIAGSCFKPATLLCLRLFAVRSWTEHSCLCLHMLKMWPIGERPPITAALPPDSRSRGCKLVITTPAQMSDNSSFPRFRITFNLYQISEDPNFTQKNLVPGGSFKYRK